MTMNIFEKASKIGLRFESGKGQLTVEDLWNLKLKGTGLSLDSLAIKLDSEIKQLSETTVSFVSKTSNVNLEIPTLKLDILKHIITVKLEEAAVKASEQEVKDKKQTLLKLLETKQQEKLMNKTEEEILEELSKLQ